MGRQTPGRVLASGEEDKGALRAWVAAAARRRRGVGSADDETPLCSPSPVVAGALGMRPYRRTTETAEGPAFTAFAANGRNGDTGRRTRRGDTSAGDSESAWLPVPGKSVDATMNALVRLLPRLGRPGIGVRRLYAGVVRSRLLYGTPIWAEDLMASRRNLLKVRRLHRTVAVRVVRGFHTISAAAAAVLAGFPPLELGTEVSRNLPPHAGSVGRGRDCGRRR